MLGALVQILASYFVLIPLRDEISVQLGTRTLPFLFVASLLVNTLAQMATSGMVTSSSTSRAASISRFYAGVSVIIGGFAVALLAASTLSNKTDSVAVLASKQTLASQSILGTAEML
jgi:uncharacterized membrane protein